AFAGGPSGGGAGGPRGGAPLPGRPGERPVTDLVAYILTGLGIGAGFALVGSGIVMIYRVTRVVNFAQGAFAVLAALTASTLLAASLPHGVAETLAVAVAAGTGLL